MSPLFLSSRKFTQLKVLNWKRRDAMASRLERSSPDRKIRVRALTGDIALCSWARHFTLTVPLSTKGYKWVPADLMLGVPGGGLASHPERTRNTPSQFIYRNRDWAPAWWATWRVCRMYLLPDWKIIKVSTTEQLSKYWFAKNAGDFA